jgi:hypothetical protein
METPLDPPPHLRAKLAPLFLPLPTPNLVLLRAREGTGVPLRLEHRDPELRLLTAAIFGEGPGRPRPHFSAKTGTAVTLVCGSSVMSSAVLSPGCGAIGAELERHVFVKDDRVADVVGETRIRRADLLEQPSPGVVRVVE